MVPKLISTICPKHPAVAEIRERLAQVDTNQRGITSFVETAGAARQKAHTELVTTPTAENFKAFARALAAEKEALAARDYGGNPQTIARAAIQEDEDTVRTLQAALRENKTAIDKFITKAVKDESERLTAMGLDPVESPALQPLRDYRQKLVEAILSCDDWLEMGADIRPSPGNAPWNQFNSLVP